MSRLAALHPVLSAIARAEKMRLAAHLSGIAALRNEDASMRASLDTLEPGAGHGEMIAVADWQLATLAAVRARLADADLLDRQSGALRARVAFANGREIAIEGVVAAEKRVAKEVALRREEEAMAMTPSLKARPSD